MFLKSEIENAKVLRWKEVGHAGGRARRLERLQVGSRGGPWVGGQSGSNGGEASGREQVGPRVGRRSGSNGGARFCTPAVLRISEP